MSRLTDPRYLLDHQYRDASKLEARIALHQRFSVNRRGLHHWLFDHFVLPDGARILELGSGSGAIWRENRRRIPAGWQITLSDLSPGMLVKMQGNLVDSHPFGYARIDAQAIPYTSATFDAVIANFMLYHTPDLAQVLSEIRRVLKPNGCLYAATVGYDHMAGLGELIQRFDPAAGPWRANEAVTFTLENGGQQLQQCFEHVSVHRYEDALLITEAAPLVAYALSMSTAPAILDERTAAFAAFVQQEIAEQGIIRIDKAAGLFVAQCAEREC